MRKKLLIFSSVILLIAMLSIAIPVQPIKAYGSAFEEGSDGFAVQKGDILKYRITDNTTMIGPFSIGDLLQLNITDCNNSMENSGTVLLPIPYYGDMIFGDIDYFNSTNSTWRYGLFTGSVLLSAYNSTNPFDNFMGLGPLPNGTYYTFNIAYEVLFVFPYFTLGYPIPPFPLNFTATNQTIVNASYMLMDIMSSSLPFFHSTPINTVEGVWTTGVGGPTTANSFKLEITLNKDGIVTKQRFYSDGTTDWQLWYELVLVESPPISDLIMLLALGGMQPNVPWKTIIIIVLAIVSGIEGVLLLFKQGSKLHKIVKGKKI